MGSLEVVSGAAALACAPSAPHPLHPRAGFAIRALPHFDEFSTFPHLAFLPEPPKGSFWQRCSLEESTLKWDITSQAAHLILMLPPLLADPQVVKRIPPAPPRAATAVH